MKAFNSIKHSLRLFLFVLLTFTIQSCSVNPAASAMVPDKIVIIKHHPYTVSLEVRVDEGDGFLENTLIKALDLQVAIETSINQSGLFTKVVQGNADYCLKVDADVPPVGGYIIIATVGGGWRLSNCTTKHVVMDKFIRTSDKKTFGDAFNGNTRLRLAVGGAVKKFVEEGLNQITQLDF